MNRKVLGLAVMTALTAGTAANAANQILFPFFKQGNGVHTLLSVVNSTSGDGVQVYNNDMDFTQRVHTIYMFKSSEGDTSDVCQHRDGRADMSQNDFMVFTPLNPAVGGLDMPAMMGGDQSKPFYMPTNVLTSSNTAAGYVIMATAEENDKYDAGAEVINTISGFGNVFDTNTGLSYSYRAISQGFNTDGSLAPNAVGVMEGDFVSNGAAGEKLPFGSNKYTISWHADTVLDTNWYVLVPGANMAGFSGDADTWADTRNAEDPLTATTSNSSTWGVINPPGTIHPYRQTISLGIENGFIFDNDEGIISSSATSTLPSITCMGAINLADIRGGYLNGGWANLTISGADYLDEQGNPLAGALADTAATAMIWRIDSTTPSASPFKVQGVDQMTTAPENYQFMVDDPDAPTAIWSRAFQ